MSDTGHRLLMLAIAFCALVLAVLMFFEPVIGMLWLALVIVTALLLAVLKPQIYRGEAERRRRKREERLNRQRGNADRFETEFKVDHMLVCLDEGDSSRYLVNSDDFLIGRDPQCKLVLTKGNTVGKRHCRILYRRYSHEYYIEDLRSLNGTYLGTRRLEPFKQEKLLDDAEVSISHFKYRFVRCQE